MFEIQKQFAVLANCPSDVKDTFQFSIFKVTADFHFQDHFYFQDFSFMIITIIFIPATWSSPSFMICFSDLRFFSSPCPSNSSSFRSGFLFSAQTYRDVASSVKTSSILKKFHARSEISFFGRQHSCTLGHFLQHVARHAGVTTIIHFVASYFNQHYNLISYKFEIILKIKCKFFQFNQIPFHFYIFGSSVLSF